MNTILGGGSQLNKLSKISEHLSSRELTVYVDNATGNDSNNGEILNPVKTITAALELQGSHGALVIVLIGAADYVFPAIPVIRNRGFIEITGGSATVVFDESSIGLSPYYFEIHNTMILVKVDVRIESVTQLQAFASLHHGSEIFFWGNTVSLLNVDYIVRANYGINTLSLGNAVITGDVALTQNVVKKVAGMSDFVFSKTGLTLTNITDNSGV